MVPDRIARVRVPIPRRMLVSIATLLLGLGYVQSCLAMRIHCDLGANPPTVFARDVANNQTKDPAETRITQSDVENMKRAVEKCRQSGGGFVVVDLHSGGGNLLAGMEMGTYLLGKRIHTRVRTGNFCVSACTFVFLGGEVREVRDGGSFEPHGFSGWRFEDSEFVSKITRPLAELRYSAIESGRPDPGLCRYFPLLSASLTRLRDLCLAIQFDQRRGDVKFHPDTSEKELRALATFAKYLSGAMMEFEREVAFVYLTKGGAGEVSIEKYVNWIITGFMRATDKFTGEHVTAEHVTSEAKDLLRAVAEMVQQQRQGNQDVARRIGQFFTARNSSGQNIVDEVAVAKLMFSTSIVYTRQLTNKEMCRSGVMTRGCVD